MNLFGKIQKTVRHNFLPQNVAHTLVESSAVFIWMGSTIVFYYVVGKIFPQLEFLQFENAIAIIATYFVGDGLMFGLLYRNLQKLGTEIEQGKVENFLLLPTNTMKYIGFRNIQFASLIQIPIALAMLLIWGEFTFLNLAFWMVSMVVGFYLAYNFWMIFSFISFWYKVGDQTTVMYEELVQMGLFPLKIYLAFKLFWPLLPIAFIASGGYEVLSEGTYWVIGVQAGILLLAVLLRNILWSLGLRRFRR